MNRREKLLISSRSDRSADLPPGICGGDSSRGSARCIFDPRHFSLQRPEDCISNASWAISRASRRSFLRCSSTPVPPRTLEVRVDRSTGEKEEPSWSI